MIEVHGRLSVECAVEVGKRLAVYRPAWYEEPVTPWSIDRLLDAKQQLSIPVAAGERLYQLEEFERLASVRACDIIQPDLVHCGGLSVGKKIAALAQACDLKLAPHCSIGPVALCAAVHFGWSTPHVMVQENFGDFDVPWRSDFVSGWQPCQGDQYLLPTKPGLGIELNDAALAQHPPQKNPFPSLWDDRWLKEFTKG
jgi:galactonate dehydratase